MNYKTKSKAELINILKELQSENNSLRALYKGDPAKCNTDGEFMLENKEYLTLIFNNASDALVLLKVESPDRLIIQAYNRSYSESFKHLFPDFPEWINPIGMDRRKFMQEYGIKDDMIDLEMPKYHEVIEKGIPVRYEFEFPKIDTKSTLDICITPVLDMKGKCTHLLWSARDITESKRIEKSLRESEGRMKDIIFSMGDWVWEVDKNGVYTYSSQKGSELLGKSNEDIIGKTPFDFMQPDEAKKIAEIFNEIAKNKLPINDLINWNIKKNGERICLLTNGVPLLDEEGNLIGYRGVDKDITERWRAEESLRNSEEKFRVLFESAKDGILLLSSNGDIVTMNTAFAEMHGYKIEEMSGMNIKELDTPEYAKLIPERMKRLFGGEQLSFEAEHYCKNGKTIPIDVSVNMVSLGGKEYILGFHRDITERKKVENELVKAKEIAEENEIKLKDKVRLLDLIFEHTLDNIALLDKDYNFIKVSETYAKSCQKSISEFAGKNHFEMFPSDFKVEADEAKKNKCIYSRHARAFIYPDHPEWGTTYWDVGFVPILDKDENIEFFILTLKDMTEEVRAESLLIKSNIELKSAKDKAEESDRLKSAFLANISHEIRTPMNGLLGFSQIISKPGLSDIKQKQYAEIIEGCGNQLLSIIDDLIDISKIEANQIKINIDSVHINSILQELYLLLQQRAINSNIKLSFSKEPDDKQCMILTDGNRLRQILINLINNAIKFTQAGYVRFGYTIKNEMIEFYVEDTGIGIKSEMHERIFDRFTQVETEFSKLTGGTGLGLPISKALVELLGGKIWLHSVFGKGTTFYFTIPFLPSVESIVKEQVTEKVNFVNSGKSNILVAEDDESNYLLLSEILSDMNMRLIPAKNGKEAIEIVKNDFTIDLVLMDIKMPVLDGYEAVAEIKKIRKDLPVIAQTSYAQTAEMEKAISAGCDGYISKPIMENKLKEIVNRYLRKK